MLVPLVVREQADGLELVAGSHRIAAARSLRLAEGPVVVGDADTEDADRAVEIITASSSTPEVRDHRLDAERAWRRDARHQAVRRPHRSALPRPLPALVGRGRVDLGQPRTAGRHSGHRHSRRRDDRAVRTVADVGAAELVRHPEWATLGLPGTPPIPPTGSFEIYLDRAGKYRWRLRRPNGHIVADSGQGYRTREECEADLRWLREHGTTAPVRSDDLD